MYENSNFEQRKLEAELFQKSSDSEISFQSSKAPSGNIPYLIRFLISCILISRVRDKVVKHRALLCQFMPNLHKSVDRDSGAVDRAIIKLSENSDVEVQMLAKSLKNNVFIIRNLTLFTISGIAVLLLIIYIFIESKQRLQTITNRRDALEEQATRSQSSETPSRERNTPSPTPTPTVNPFDQELFPKGSCGDTAPVNPRRYPVSFYPVFANYSERNLARISNQYCQDAYGPISRDNGQRSIQVASFLSRDKAELFRQFMSEQVPPARWEIGEPNTLDSPP